MKISKKTQEWLLNAKESYIQYNAKRFFEIKTDQSELLNDPFIKENIILLNNWDKEVLKNHSRPQLLIHRLALLTDLGIKAEDKPIKPIIKSILNDFDGNGIPQVSIELPKVFGGSGVPEKAWMICDFPVILAALLKMKVKDEKVKTGLSRLENFVIKIITMSASRNPL